MKRIIAALLAALFTMSVLITPSKANSGRAYILDPETTSEETSTYDLREAEYTVALEEQYPIPETEEAPADIPYSEEEIDLIALVTMAEAEGEPEEGKRLVIDTILNRVDDPHFPDTVHGVIYQPNQFTCMWNGRSDRCCVRADIRELVLQEMVNRTDHDVVFFRTGHYSSYGTPLFQVGHHYFSAY